MAQEKNTLPITYHIRTKGMVNSSCAALLSAAGWLDEITLLPQENDETLLVGQFIDQPALRGFLEHLWNLNFTVLSVEIIESQDNED